MVIPGISTISSGVIVRSCTGEYPAWAKIRNNRCSNRSLIKTTLLSSFFGICKGAAPQSRPPAGLLLPASDLEKDQPAEDKEYQYYRNDRFQFHSQFLLSQILTAV